MKQRIPRPGSALLGVLIALSAITIVLTVVSAQVFAQRKMLQTRHQQLQADWLTRAGIECAAERLLQKADAFTEVKSDFVSQGTVRIVVEKSANMEFVATIEATMTNETRPPVIRQATASFRRIEKGGSIHLERLSVPSK